MGQSSDAILFFGYDLGDSEDDGYVKLPWMDENDTLDSWEDVWAEKKGLVRPKHLYGIKEWTPEQRKEYEEYRDKREELVEDVGVGISSHCSCHYPMYYIYTKQFRASQGYGMVVRPVMLEVDGEDIRKLREFCEFLGIDVGDMKPEWHLVSDWC
jgi:hypothetical protein